MTSVYDAWVSSTAKHLEGLRVRKEVSASIA